MGTHPHGPNPHDRHGPHGSHGHVPRIFRGRGSRFYDLAARWLLRGVYRRLADDIAAVAPQDGDVLDVGTGPGMLLVEIARRRPDLRLTGVDPSTDMVTATTRNLGRFGTRAAARVGSATDLPFPDRSFDLVVTSFSLHHWDDPEAAVPELARVLRPAGRLHVYDFRSAPFDALTSAARAGSWFTGAPPERTSLRTGIPFLPPCSRHVMSIG